MLSEEALVQLPVGRQQPLAYQRYVRPALEAVAVAVRAILHDVTAMRQSPVVYLPEDDVAAACGSDAVVLIDLLQSRWSNAEPRGHIRRHPLPKNTAWRLAAHNVFHRQRLEGRQRRRCGTQVSHLWLTASETLAYPFVPRVVVVVFRRSVVIAAGVLVVAFAHRVVQIAKTIVGIDVSYETLPLAALRTGELTRLMAGESLGL